MAAKLNYDILESNLELIRDRIGVILTEEMANQATRQTDPDLNPGIWVERYTAPDKAEEKIVIIGIERGNYEDQTNVHQKGDFNYYIDVYTTGKKTPSTPGYLASSKKNQRLAALIRSILQAPEYIKLGFDDKSNPVIYRRAVSGINFDLTNDVEDGSFFRMCRVTLKVEFHEEQPAAQPITATGYDTQVKLELTDKGYKYVINN